MDARDWITEFAGGLDVAPPDDETFDTLLELAGVAAHASERIAAPIACYLVGLARVDPARALELARGLESDDA
jgi:Domain of unknown function (DUF6457)